MMAPSGWYADPAGGGGLRFWDGAAWTEHTRPAPTATSAPAAASGSVRRARTGRRVALAVVMVLAVLIADVGLRNLGTKRLIGTALASEAVMLSFTERMVDELDMLPADGPASDDEWFDLLDAIHASAVEHFLLLEYRAARVAAVPIAPWHTRAREARSHYLEHSRAWRDELDGFARDPEQLFGPSSGAIGSTWRITRSAMRDAVPLIDLLGIGEDVERFIREGDAPGGAR